MNKYTDLMPDMSPDDFQRLKEDIRKNGIMEPLLFDQDNNLIDGKHRLRAFYELTKEGVDLPMFDKTTRVFESEQARLDAVMSLNLNRRHLKPEQRIEVAIKLRLPPYSLSTQKIAEMLSVSVGTVAGDLSTMTAEEKAQLANAKFVRSDGREYSPTYAPRVFVTGQEQLRQMQVQAVAAAQSSIAQMPLTTDGSPAPTTAPAAPAPNGHITPGGGGATPVTRNGAGQPLVIVSQPVAPPTPAEAMRRFSAFAWYGGKGSHLSWLLPLLPPCVHFVDVFGGSAAVIMNRQPSQIETYNDIDNELVNFFKVLREQPDELMRQLTLTPFSREERRAAFLARKESNKGASDLERARRFFVLARQTRSGMAQNTLDSVLNSWKWTRDSIQRGMSSQVSQWQTGIDGLAAVAARFRTIQIESYPALEVIRLYDSPGTLFYCDPPYVHDTRSKGDEDVYNVEMSNDDHRALAAALQGIKGRAAVSGYPCELYEELYEKNGWHYFDMPAMSKDGKGQAAERVERLWTNYPLTEAHRTVATLSEEYEVDADSEGAFEDVAVSYAEMAKK